MMTSVAGFALMTGFWSYNQKANTSRLIEGIVQIPEIEDKVSHDVITDALIQTVKTPTGRKVLEQMYSYYGKNNQQRINITLVVILGINIK